MKVCIDKEYHGTKEKCVFEITMIRKDKGSVHGTKMKCFWMITMSRNEMRSLHGKNLDVFSTFGKDRELLV